MCFGTSGWPQCVLRVCSACVHDPGFYAALLDVEFNKKSTPYKKLTIPGRIHATDYDIGNEGVAYSDTKCKLLTSLPLSLSVSLKVGVYFDLVLTNTLFIAQWTLKSRQAKGLGRWPLEWWLGISEWWCWHSQDWQWWWNLPSIYNHREHREHRVQIKKSIGRHFALDLVRSAVK